MKVHIPKIAAAALAAGAIAALGFGVAGPALAATSCGANCTNGTVNVGSTIGTSGFPTSFAISGAAGTTSSATASPYSVYSNEPWTLTFSTDPSDNVALNGYGGEYSAVWATTSASFPIGSSTTITHNGVTDSFPATGTPPYENTGTGESVQIDSGGPTSGGIEYTDTFNVAIGATQAPGLYSAQFDYTLTG